MDFWTEALACSKHNVPLLLKALCRSTATARWHRFSHACFCGSPDKIFPERLRPLCGLHEPKSRALSWSSARLPLSGTLARETESHFDHFIDSKPCHSHAASTCLHNLPRSAKIMLDYSLSLCILVGAYKIETHALEPWRYTLDSSRVCSQSEPHTATVAAPRSDASLPRRRPWRHRRTTPASTASATSGSATCSAASAPPFSW
jgi:hypothetical protein